MQQGYGYGPPGWAPPAAAAPGSRVCPGCGVIAPLARTSCNVCNAAFGAPPIVASGRVGTAVFVCVHAADFTCKACGIRSPLATVDCDGQVECMGCGLQQPFDVVQWTDALAFAHGVGDLSGPNLDPVAARSRHAKIGSEFTSSTKTQSAMIMDGGGMRTHSLRTSVSPGHPICKTCRVPLEAWFEGSTARTRCPRCNDAASYGLPPNASMTYAPLRAVLANEQRTDRPVAALGRTPAGVESIMCPQCGAGLSAGGGTELVKCLYCGLASRIPGTLARQQRRGAVPKMDPFWVLLEGPSPGRQRLVQGKSEDPDDDDGDDDDDDDDDDESAAVAPPGYGAPYAQNFMAAPPAKSNALKVVIILAAVGLLLSGGVVAGVLVWMNLEEEPAAPAATPAATPLRPATKRR